jgi:hypothetical protein
MPLTQKYTAIKNKFRAVLCPPSVVGLIMKCNGKGFVERGFLRI